MESVLEFKDLKESPLETFLSSPFRRPLQIPTTQPLFIIHLHSNATFRSCLFFLSGFVVSLVIALAMTKRKHQHVLGGLETAAFWQWGTGDAIAAAKLHPLPCVLAVSLILFMGVEYTLQMVPSTAPPFDLGFLATRSLNHLLASTPALNTFLAALNTVFVAMQFTYITSTFVVEGRFRPVLATLFMFTCRGILGYSTQLPLPQEFLGSGADFPVGNVSFFMFFSGHVAGSVIASIDMRREKRKELAWTFDALNLLQVVRLLGTRGHYTIDLAVGVGAALLFDFLAGVYIHTKNTTESQVPEQVSNNTSC